MSVNLSYAISEKRTKHLGKYFTTIDFVVEGCTKRFLEAKQNQTTVGKFYIGESSQYINLGTLNYVLNSEDVSGLQLPDQLTKFEKERIIETFHNAKTVFWQKIRLNVR